MSVATSTALIIGGVAAAAATVAGAAIASHGNTEAAGKTADAATTAAQIQSDSTNKALDFTKGVYATKQGQVAPYIGYGQGALAALGNGLGVTPTAQPPVAMPGAGTASVAPKGTIGSLGELGVDTAPMAVAPPTTLDKQQAANQRASAQTSSSVAPKMGEQRVINGQVGQWDGSGWLAVGAGTHGG